MLLAHTQVLPRGLIGYIPEKYTKWLSSLPVEVGHTLKLPVIAR